MDQKLTKFARKGQSLVELALIMPILVIILAGAVEFGYYGERNQSLTEVARTTARAGVALQNELSPKYWEEESTDLLLGSEVEQKDAERFQAWLDKYRNCNPMDTNADIGFYNFLGCIALQSMSPLRITGFEPGASTSDDIVISAFTITPDGDKMKVIARYPSNANECVPDDQRTSLGFVWSGNYRNEQGCMGSNFSNEEVEQLMNLDEFELGIRPKDLARYVVPQGIVLVEIHWQHETLSQFIGLAPVLSPVAEILGMKPVITTWAMFPLPQIGE